MTIEYEWSSLEPAEDNQDDLIIWCHPIGVHNEDEAADKAIKLRLTPASSKMLVNTVCGVLSVKAPEPKPDEARAILERLVVNAEAVIKAMGAGPLVIAHVHGFKYNGPHLELDEAKAYLKCTT